MLHDHPNRAHINKRNCYIIMFYMILYLSAINDNSIAYRPFFCSSTHPSSIFTRVLRHQCTHAGCNAGVCSKPALCMHRIGHAQDVDSVCQQTIRCMHKRFVESTIPATITVPGHRICSFNLLEIPLIPFTIAITSEKQQTIRWINKWGGRITIHFLSALVVRVLLLSIEILRGGGG